MVKQLTQRKTQISETELLLENTGCHHVLGKQQKKSRGC